MYLYLRLLNKFTKLTFKVQLIAVKFYIKIMLIISRTNFSYSSLLDLLLPTNLPLQVVWTDIFLLLIRFVDWLMSKVIESLGLIIDFLGSI